jgi:hypothetical protein
VLDDKAWSGIAGVLSVDAGKVGACVEVNEVFDEGAQFPHCPAVFFRSYEAQAIGVINIAICARTKC